MDFWLVKIYAYQNIMAFEYWRSLLGYLCIYAKLLFLISLWSSRIRHTRTHPHTLFVVLWVVSESICNLPNRDPPANKEFSCDNGFSSRSFLFCSVCESFMGFSGSLKLLEKLGLLKTWGANVLSLGGVEVRALGVGTCEGCWLTPHVGQVPAVVLVGDW